MLLREIVVVDDCKEWRRIVSSILGTKPELRVIAEATDGAEAVQNAEELRPDLIVLDIGLPRLNGINAAEEIFEVSPASKILFLSGISDPDVVQVALSTGASGYVHKHNAATDLLPAVLAALDGARTENDGLLSSSVIESLFQRNRSAVSEVADPEKTARQAEHSEGIQSSL
jgi:DNA-binding NarL/FixJ family response regulator